MRCKKVGSRFTITSADAGGNCGKTMGCGKLLLAQAGSSAQPSNGTIQIRRTYGRWIPSEVDDAGKRAVEMFCPKSDE